MAKALDEAYQPPPLPPPLLSSSQLTELAYQGHVPIVIPPKLQDILRSLDRASQVFFEQDAASKAKAHPNTQGTELGYYVVENEKEYLTIRHSHQPVDLEDGVAQSCKAIDEHVGDLWRTTAAMMYRILMNVSASTGIDPTAWGPLLDGCLDLPPDFANSTPSLLRLFRYESEQGVAGEHTDNGLLTLCVGAEKGLQVWRKHLKSDVQSHGVAAESRVMETPHEDGHWEDVQGPTLLAGTALRILTTNRVAAGKHRVVSNPKGRRSIVFALRPSTRHHLDLAAFGGEGTWDMALLWKRITSGRVNVNAHQTLREEQARKREEARQKQRLAENEIGSAVSTGAG